jgi:hypothetical protein
MRLDCSVRLAAVAAVITVVSPHLATAAGLPPEKPTPPTPPRPVEVRFADDSLVRLTLRDEKIEIDTKYGRLAIPVADVRSLDAALRLSSDESRRITAAVADLGHADFRKRESASAALLALEEKALAALQKAAESGDAEVGNRAKTILEQIRERVPARRLNVRYQDLIQTTDGCRVTGWIVAPELRVKTQAFGEQTVRMADVRCVRAIGLTREDAGGGEVIPDPGNMTGFREQVGKTLRIKLTGEMPNAPGGGGRGGGLWGTDVYTLDSSVAVAAVHAGAVKPGETKVVRVNILPPQPAFQGSVRNGVMSNGFGPYNGAFTFRK